MPCVLFSFPLPRTQPYVVCSDFIYVSSYHCRAYPQDIHLRRTVKLFYPSRLLGTMASADFSQFVVTTDRAPSVRPHGISPEPFPVYSPDLRIEVTIAFLDFDALCHLIRSIRLDIRFLSVEPRFRYCFFSPVPHDTNLANCFKVRRQLRPSGLPPEVRDLSREVSQTEHDP